MPPLRYSRRNVKENFGNRDYATDVWRVNFDIWFLKGL
jgi:hypothetical protein